MGLRAVVVGLAAILAATAPAPAQPAGYDDAFVSAFAEACVPGRLRYDTSIAAARAAGWREVAPDAEPRLGAVLAFAEASAAEEDDYLSEVSFEYTPFARDVAGVPHHLVVSRSSMVFDDREDPWVFLGCYLYNFDAKTPLDPAPVTELIGHPISDTREAEGYVGHVWGPPCPMPRTGDTYLNFVAEGGALSADIPFVGIALTFTTSELPEGSEPPDPYC